jgi:hypothetical protein
MAKRLIVAQVDGSSNLLIHPKLNGDFSSMVEYLTVDQATTDRYRYFTPIGLLVLKA